MKATLVIVAAAACFGGFLVWTHRTAGELVEREDAACEVLVGEETLPARRGGYRFETVSATGALPGLRVASPERHAETGVRWFVTADREAVYAFDPIQRSVRDNRPDLAPIRRFLAKPQGDPPVGWVRVR